MAEHLFLVDVMTESCITESPAAARRLIVEGHVWVGELAVDHIFHKVSKLPEIIRVGSRRFYVERIGGYWHSKEIES